MSFDDRKPFILLSGKSDILKFAFFQLSEFSESQILFTDQRVNGDNARIFQHFIEIKGLEFILSLFDHSWWFVGSWIHYYPILKLKEITVLGHL